MSKSVLTVSGLQLTRMASTPWARMASTACTQQQSNSMPWPIRLGPEPRTMALGLDVGGASERSSQVW
jgi:hypothetical protein